MGLYKFNNVGIKAISATVPHRIVKTRELTSYYSKEAIEKFIEATGVEERRLSDTEICASDLCYKSACEIFDKTNITRDDIDMLIFISQTPDYKSPGTSILLQDRLNLNKNTLVYDVNMSCSGFIHGLLMAYSFLQLSEIHNVMIMVGDTLSKLTSIQDKGTGMLLGDAGITSVISKSESFGESFFSMSTDGSNLSSVQIPAGGSRKPSSTETMVMKTYSDGSMRSEEQVVMEGSDVFSFAISELPRDIKKLLQFAEKSIDEIDKYAFHQANNFMTGYIAKKVKANPSKLLKSINKYGNTAGTSIPLCLVENKRLINNGDLVLMNAIGAGFAYGTVLLRLVDCQILNLSEL